MEGDREYLQRRRNLMNEIQKISRKTEDLQELKEEKDKLQEKLEKVERKIKRLKDFSTFSKKLYFVKNKVKEEDLIGLPQSLRKILFLVLFSKKELLSHSEHFEVERESGSAVSSFFSDQSKKKIELDKKWKSLVEKKEMLTLLKSFNPKASMLIRGSFPRVERDYKTFENEFKTFFITNPVVQWLMVAVAIGFTLGLCRTNDEAMKEEIFKSVDYIPDKEEKKDEDEK